MISFSYAKIFKVCKAYVLVYIFVFIFADDKFGRKMEVQAEGIVIVCISSVRRIIIIIRRTAGENESSIRKNEIIDSFTNK